MNAALPDFLRVLLANCPRAGGGVHAWLYNTARQLHAHMPDKRAMADLLEACAANCGRIIPRREIVDAVKHSQQTAWQPNGTGIPATTPASKPWPNVNVEKRGALLREHPIALADLWELSPVWMDGNESRTEPLVDALFPGNPLLCCGRSSSIFDTKPREDWRGQLSELQLIVPSPMTEATGLTQNGKMSAHALSNTGPRRFLVVEFDSGTFDEHATLLWHLAKFGPLVLAVHSGGKSLHGWFYCAGHPEDRLNRFMHYAVSLGADFATWTRSQFVRMPDGTRDIGARQAVYYFSTKPLGIIK